MSDEARIEVWQEPDLFWRWRYRDPNEGVDLLSNESHLHRAEAERSAATAYPGVPVVEGPPTVTGLGLAQTAKRTAVIGTAAAGAAAVAPLAAIVAWRRRRKKRRQRT